MGINNANATAMCSTQRWVVTVIALSLIAYTLISFRSLQFHLDLPSTPVQTPIKEQRHQVFSEVPKNEASAITNLVFHSADIFNRTYAEMEQKFKVYIYPDGDPKTFYQTPRKLTGKYASEGYFFQNIRESRFRTDNPEEAHLFFIPISCHKMRGKGTSYENMTVIVQNYVESLANKYPYWNRTLGADHFFVTCHDVGVRATEGLPFLVKNAIRVVCSPSYDVGYIPHKDVALPQVLQPFALPGGGNDIQNRTVLGFWAGHRNSRIRVILARLWENDTDRKSVV